MAPIGGGLAVSRTGSYVVRSLGSGDVELLKALLGVFGEAFDDAETYCSAQPGLTYMQRLLGSECFIALAALEGDEVVGGITAYELRKFEQERSEIYIYDLAVGSAHRRRGVATALIDELKRVAASRGAWVVFVQADLGDEPAIALYSKLGVREDVLHFDIAPQRKPDVSPSLGARVVRVSSSS
jgi:aminoglycoside 3-N-acetyltransferase I